MRTFLLANTQGEGKNRNAEGLLYDLLDHCLRSQLREFPVDNHLMDPIATRQRRHYLPAQQEALAFLSWITKFAEAWLQKQR